MSTKCVNFSEDLSGPKSSSSSDSILNFYNSHKTEYKNGGSSQSNEISAIFEKDFSRTYSNVCQEVEQLRKKLQNKQCQLDEAHCKISHLQNQINEQSKFCTTVGAVFCTLICRASISTEIIDVWLLKFQNELGNFFSIVAGVFVSFVNVHKETSSMIDDDALKFVMGLLGTVVNISAYSKGREFLISRTNGKELLQKLIKHLPGVMLPAGQNLKRQILSILYNVSKNVTGLQELYENRVYEVLDPYLDESTSLKLQIICVRLLQSLTSGKYNHRLLNSIRRYITTEKIELLSHSTNYSIAKMASKIKRNLQK